MSAVTVIARAKARAGSEAALEKAVREVVKPTQAEQGCLKYVLHRSLEDKAVFLIVERWDSKESHERHLAAPHVQRLFSQLPPLLAAAPDIQVFEALSEGDGAKGAL